MCQFRYTYKHSVLKWVAEKRHFKLSVKMMVIREVKEEPKSMLFQSLIHSHFFIRNFFWVMQIVTGVESYKFPIK